MVPFPEVCTSLARTTKEGVCGLHLRFRDVLGSALRQVSEGRNVDVVDKTGAKTCVPENIKHKQNQSKTQHKPSKASTAARSKPSSQHEAKQSMTNHSKAKQVKQATQSNAKQHQQIT